MGTTTTSLAGGARSQDLDLDQFFTPPEVVTRCLATLRDVLRKHKVPLRKACYVEPAMGSGAFFQPSTTLAPHGL
jgi:hypothetical protein